MHICLRLHDRLVAYICVEIYFVSKCFIIYINCKLKYKFVLYFIFVIVCLFGVDIFLKNECRLVRLIHF